MTPGEASQADRRAMPAPRRWRSLTAVIASSAVGGLTFGMTLPLLALLLDRDGVDSTWIGVNAAAASLAVVVVGIEGWAPFLASAALLALSAAPLSLPMAALRVCRPGPRRHSPPPFGWRR